MSKFDSDSSFFSLPFFPIKRKVRRPANGDYNAWGNYWINQGQPWRRCPEINKQRQAELAKSRKIIPDLWERTFPFNWKGDYPFSGMKLDRADIEWLLATHENGRGPIDWSDESQRERNGLDLSGADLSGAFAKSMVKLRR